MPSCKAAVENNKMEFPNVQNAQREIINKEFRKILALAVPNAYDLVKKGLPGGVV